MGDLKAKLRTLIRRSSVSVSPPTSIITTADADADPHHPHAESSPSTSPTHTRSRSLKSPSFSSLRKPALRRPPSSPRDDTQPAQPRLSTSSSQHPVVVKNDGRPPIVRKATGSDSVASGDLRTLESSHISHSTVSEEGSEGPICPDLVIQQASPESEPSEAKALQITTGKPKKTVEVVEEPVSPVSPRKKAVSLSSRSSPRESKRQSLVNHVDADAVQPVPQDDLYRFPNLQTPRYIRHVGHPSTSSAIHPVMLHRKVWVKRPNTSATIVQVREDDLVDEVKDSIIQKFRNSLGRTFDAPDVVIRIAQRDRPGDRALNPDETICRVLDNYYPQGQTIDEALIIEVPIKARTPRPSPRGHHYQTYDVQEQDERRPHESGTDYFPLMPPAVQMSPAIMANSVHEARHVPERAMTVLTTGHVPPLPSPGATRRAHGSRSSRPNYNRQQTSPNLLASSLVKSNARPRLDSAASNDKLPHSALHSVVPQQAPAIPTPPAPDGPKTVSTPPTPRVASPRPTRQRKIKQKSAEPATAVPPSIGGIDTAVPPINVLIVEDNHINMKLLEQFIRRLKVRWQTAVNGREAVDKWKMGGFHLVLMDIQLPIMSGLEATKEIRRLERVNNIGVFSNTPSENEATVNGSNIKEEDRLADPVRSFKSPVIIVALTASNLQSDRHEALAAGCNDFLTKPVNFVWFERKVKEWGCMQALIDFDGWRKWKDFATQNGLKDASAPNAKAAGLKSTASAAAANKDGLRKTSPNSIKGSSSALKKLGDTASAAAAVAPTVGAQLQTESSEETVKAPKGVVA